MTERNGEHNKLKLLLQRHLRVRHLVLLTAIAQHGSLLKAAFALNLTQSATTRALLELEHALDLRLFNRSSRGVTPTEYGRTLINHAETILGEIRHTADDLTELMIGSSGRVVVGTLRAAAPSLLPKSLAIFKAVKPNVTVTVLQGNFQNLSQALRVGELDMIVGYVSEFRSSEGFVREKLYDDAAAIAVRRGHPLLKRKKQLGLKELMEWPWILPLRDTVFRRYVDAGFRSAGVEPPAAFIETVTTSLIQAVLTESDSLVALPRPVAEQFKGLGFADILNVNIGGGGLPVGMTLRADQEPSASALALVEIMRRVAQRSVRPAFQK